MKPYKKIGAAALLLAIVLTFGAWTLPASVYFMPGPVILTPEQEREIASQTGTDFTANPFSSVENMKQAEQRLGYGLEAPKTYKGYRQTEIQVCSKDMVQIFYTDAEDHEILLRKGTQGKDLTGDYNVYPSQKTLTLTDKKGDNVKVTARTKDGRIYSAFWKNGTYSYAVDALDAGLTEREFAQWVGQIA